MTIIVHQRQGRYHYGAYAHGDGNELDQSGMFQSEAYVCGDLPPHYRVPCTEYVNALAMSPDRISFYTKMLLLRAGEFPLNNTTR